MLCNVAGVGGSKDYLKVPLDTLHYMVDLNVKSCMSMSLLLVPLLEKNTPSFILNVGSMAGFGPIPSKNMYSATKSSVIFFSYTLGDRLWGDYGFYDAINLTEGWTANSYLAIDQGPIIVMIENHRTGLLWDLFMSAPEIQGAKTILGFH